MKLVIDNEKLSCSGSVDELLQDIAKLLVIFEKDKCIQVQKSLKIIAAYSLIFKNDLL